MDWILRAQKGALAALALTMASLTGACASSQNPSNLKDGASPYTQRRGSASEGQDIAVGAFNLLRLGHGSKNMQRVVSVIDMAKYDIFAAQEIMNPAGAEELLTALRDGTGQDWRMTLSASSNGESTYKEYKGFYYRAEAVEATLPTRAFCKTREGVDRVESSCFARDNGGDYMDFERDPFVGHFKVHGVPVALISVHLVYGDSIERRQGEALTLRGVMDDVRQKTPGSTVMTLGDFNLTVVNDDDAPAPQFDRYLQQAMPEEVFSNGPLIDGIFDGPTTIGSSSYDHILYYEDIEGSLLPLTVKVIHDIDDTNDADQRALFRAEVSDHYAIAARFRIH